MVTKVMSEAPTGEFDRRGCGRVGPEHRTTPSPGRRVESPGGNGGVGPRPVDPFVGGRRTGALRVLGRQCARAHRDRRHPAGALGHRPAAHPVGPGGARGGPGLRVGGHHRGWRSRRVVGRPAPRVAARPAPDGPAFPPHRPRRGREAGSIRDAAGRSARRVPTRRPDSTPSPAMPPSSATTTTWGTTSTAWSSVRP